jgi:hypothetical protein
MQQGAEGARTDVLAANELQPVGAFFVRQAGSGFDRALPVTLFMAKPPRPFPRKTLAARAGPKWYTFFRAGSSIMTGTAKLSALIGAFLCLIGAARAAELENPGAYARPYYLRLPPERHVIEVVWHGVSDRFIINGVRFAAKTPACVGWLAGERVRFLYGSIDGACVDAVVYNATRRETCEMWCAGRVYGGW